MNIIYATTIENYRIWSRYDSNLFHTVLVDQDKRAIQNLKDQFVMNAHPFDDKLNFGKGYYFIKKMGVLTHPATGRKSYYASALFKVDLNEPFFEEVEVELYLSPLYNYSSIGRKDIAIEKLIGATISVEQAFVSKTYTSKGGYKTLNYKWNITGFADNVEHI